MGEGTWFSLNPLGLEKYLYLSVRHSTRCLKSVQRLWLAKQYRPPQILTNSYHQVTSVK